MSGLSDEGRNVVSNNVARHGFSEDAVTHMLIAVSNGQGTQAQFNHFEFGGMGQWSMGGMIMIGDMFNNGLKSRVDFLCNDLSNALQNASVFAPVASLQSQSQGGYGMNNNGGTSLFVAAPGSSWPEELGFAASQGAQNDMRYAYFPDTQRLAISVGGVMTVYDCGQHQIGGFGQQQSGDQSLTFTSQFGTVRVADLPIVPMGNAPEPYAEPAPMQATTPPPTTEPLASSPPVSPPPPAQTDDDEIFARIEKLADFHQRGILDDDEYSAKKAELLARL
ncbi:MAG: SHOCT domain-containing protein [Rhodobacteraceae bacterium]|nr:SHOCT domain-containing protein [Paracoccaceae bacterium]